MDRLGFKARNTGTKGLFALLILASALLFAAPAQAERPELPQKAATKFAKTMVDEGYFSRKNIGYGTSWSQPSPTAWKIELEWGNGRKTCAQQFKIRLIDGRIAGNESETVCSEARWPESASREASSLRRISGSGPLTRMEAGAAAVGAAYNDIEYFLPVSSSRPRCARVNGAAFLCRVRVTGENGTMGKLKNCRFRVMVTKDRTVATEVLARKCVRSDRPHLSLHEAIEAADRLVDESYRRAEDSSGGLSRGNLTSYAVEYIWDVDDRFCLQVFKLKLIEGKLASDSGEAACTDQATWPSR